eukprot:5139587-Amphidinium_carterae.1
MGSSAAGASTSLALCREAGSGAVLRDAKGEALSQVAPTTRNYRLLSLYTLLASAPALTAGNGSNSNALNVATQ